jgi:hypothetical protein
VTPREVRTAPRRTRADARAPSVIGADPVGPAGGAGGAVGRAGRLMPWTVAAVAFLVYLRTMAPALHLGDGPELAAAAHVLGVPHPTGYPLQMILLKLVTLLVPVGEVITRTTLFSALCMAAAAGVTADLLRALLAGAEPAMPAKAALIAGACGGAAAAFLQFHWANATVTEVYALQFLLSVVFFRMLAKFFSDSSVRALLGSALCLGLGFAHHRLTVTLAPALLIALLVAGSRLGASRAWRLAAASAAVVAACLALYLYLPVRASALPAINWGDTRSLPNLMHHVGGGDYPQHRLLQATPGNPFTGAAYMRFSGRITAQLLNDFAAQMAPLRRELVFRPEFGRAFSRPSGAGWAVLCALGILFALGALRLSRGAPWISLCVAAATAANLLVVYLYNIADVTDYYLVPFWAGWLCVFAGAVNVLARGGRWRLPAEAYYALALAPVAILAAQWQACDRSRDDSAETLAATVLPEQRDIMPEGSVLVTGGDWDIYSAWYKQIARRERTDVLVVGANFMHQPWYPAFFTDSQKSQYGLLFASAVPKGPDAAQQFAELVRAGVLEHNVGRVPVFTSLQDDAVLREWNRRYDLRVAARSIVADPLTGSDTTCTLVRIDPQDQTTTAGAAP